MTDQRRKRVVRLLAEDGLLQALMPLSPTDIGLLAMAGDISLQAGRRSIQNKRHPSTVIGTDTYGAPDYGSLVIRLNAGSASKNIFDPSIWSLRNDYLRKCLYAIIDLHPALVGLEDTAPRPGRVRQNKAAPSKPRRSKRTRVEPRAHAPSANAPILVGPEHLASPSPHPSMSRCGDEPEAQALTSWERLSSWVAGRR